MAWNADNADVVKRGGCAHGYRMRRTLYTLAFPELTERELQWVNQLRHKHDAHTASMVGPHFTLVFGCSDLDEVSYLENVERIASAFSPIEFCCRYASVGKDHESDAGYAFLVPDEGNSRLMQLHDQLYTGYLARHLRLDIPFIPHITVGRCKTRELAKQLCDSLNETPFQLSGVIRALTVVAQGKRTIDNVGKYTFQRNAV